MAQPKHVVVWKLETPQFGLVSIGLEDYFVAFRCRKTFSFDVKLPHVRYSSCLAKET